MGTGLSAGTNSCEDDRRANDHSVRNLYAFITGLSLVPCRDCSLPNTAIAGMQPTSGCVTVILKVSIDDHAVADTLLISHRLDS